MTTIAGLTRRSDGRLEVAENDDANRAFGCREDDWCVLADNHDGECNEQRESDSQEAPAPVRGAAFALNEEVLAAWRGPVEWDDEDQLDTWNAQDPLGRVSAGDWYALLTGAVADGVLVTPAGVDLAFVHEPSEEDWGSYAWQLSGVPGTPNLLSSWDDGKHLARDLTGREAIASFLEEGAAEGNGLLPYLAPAKLVPLSEPLTIDQLRRSANGDGYVTAVVAVDLDTIAERTFESFIELLDKRVTGTEVGLEDVGYRPVGALGQSVLIEVVGKVEEFLARNDEGGDQL